jgi:lipopolysaccharide/colanic/teichoic acid biosynthesis glycosyltransferase
VWLPRPSWRLREALKRLIDVSVASLGLLLLSPVFLLLAVVVRASSRGPALYRWRVVGRDGKPFVGYKFRTMVADADLLKPALRASNEMNGPVFKMRNDPRVTRTGRWLRRASLDELPQLWSVLKGDMSLVGPRPPLEEEYENFEPWHRLKLSVKPGMTCLWQVGGRSEVRDFDRLRAQGARGALSGVRR